MCDYNGAMQPNPKKVETSAAQADQAIRGATWLSAASALQAAAEQWQASPWLGLDTEFVRERTFYPRPGLVQVSDGQHVWLVDAMAEMPFSALAATLSHADTVKVLHSVGEDLEVLALLTNGHPQPLFDTQRAAALLGHPLQVRYEHLVEEVLGAVLPGGMARSDWCRRPLDESLLHYAAADVIWLPRLAEALAEALQARDRLNWLQEDCARMLEQAHGDPAPAIVRVKGAAGLDDEVLAIAAQLAEWRDRQAQQRNLPRSFVLKDEHLVALAKDGEEALRALPAPLQRQHGDALRAALATGPNSDFQRPLELQALSSEDRAAIKALQAKVLVLAEALGVDAAVLASKKQLTRLVRGERPDWLEGWRGPLFASLL